MEQLDNGAAARERLMPAPIGALAVLVLVLAAALLLRQVSDLVVQLLSGSLLALIAWPMLAALQRAKVPSPIALGVTTLVTLCVVIGGCAIIALSLGELVTLIPTYEDRLVDVIASVETLIAQFGIRTDSDALLAVMSPEQVAAHVGAAASSVSNAGVAVIVIALTMIYALAGASTLQRQAERSIGRDHPIIAGVTRLGADVRRFLVVRAQVGLFGAVFTFLLLIVLDVPLPALWAFLVFAASFIPNIGWLLSLTPPAIVALLDSGVGTAVAVVVGFSIINFVQDNILQPMAVGSELNMTPLVAFVGVIAWTWILGPAGAILAIPLTLALADILESSPSTRALSMLMRSEVPDDAGPSRNPAGVAPANA